MKQRSKTRRTSAATETNRPAASHPASSAAFQGTRLDGSRERLPRTAGIAFVVAASLVCIGYTLYTDQTWEDSLITLRHSENLLKGEGLTFNTGTRVHGFTSPINVLLLAICHLATGQSSYAATFWLYRIFTVAAFAASGVLLLKTLYETPPRWAAAMWFLAVFYLFDVKTVAFSTNGMESAFMLLFVAWAVYLMSRGAPDLWLMRGLCWGGLMWSRPDSCVYIAVLSLAELTFLSVSRRGTLASLVKSVAVCLVIYGPWIIWAWAYYGSPIPHTIIAKANIEQGPMTQFINAFDRFPESLLTIAAQAFRPIYYNEHVGWLRAEGLERVLNVLTKFVGLVALFYFIWPVNDRLGRAASLCFALTCGYFTCMTRAYPWYFPPATLLGALAFTRAATEFAGFPQGAWSRRKFVVVAAFIVLGTGAILLLYPASLEQKIFQAEVENGNRAEIGKWLKENVSEKENVYLEPLGYVGYFSGRHIDDYPGLVSPEVVKLRKELPKDPQSYNIGRLLLIPKLKPDWVVLRLAEYQVLMGLPMFQEFKQQYVFWREFNVQGALSKYRYVPGEDFILFDSYFAIFRRTSSSP